MLPELQIGTLTLPTYAVMYALAAFVGGAMAYARMRQRPGNPDQQRFALLLMIVAILIGLFLPAWIVSQAVGLISGQPAQPVRMRVYYGLACGLLAVYLYCRKNHLPLLEPLDRLIPVFALAFGIARVGCLAAGCCGGAPTSAWVGMYLPDDFGQWDMRYPTQIMSGVFELGLFFGLTRLNTWRHRTNLKLPGWLRADGLIFYLYVFLFCLERFTLEFMRADYAPIWKGLSQPHLWMLVGGLLSLLMLWVLASRAAARR